MREKRRVLKVKAPGLLGISDITHYVRNGVRVRVRIRLTVRRARARDVGVRQRKSNPHLNP